jgi:hypothetical protein
MQHGRHDEAAAGQELLDQELVPLAIAATIAYHHITDAARQVSERSRVRDIVHVAAMALSTVARIYRNSARPVALTEQEVRELLFRPRGEIAQVDLDAYAVRRGDLRSALATLKEARGAFGKP